jgi:hypothetical protein
MRIGIVTLSEVAGPAIRTASTGNRRAYDYTVSRPEIADQRPYVLDDPDAFMAENRAGFHPGERTSDEVKVCPADGRGSQSHNGVRRLLDLGIWHILQTDIAFTSIDDGFHSRSPLSWYRACKTVQAIIYKSDYVARFLIARRTRARYAEDRRS